MFLSFRYSDSFKLIVFAGISCRFFFFFQQLPARFIHFGALGIFIIRGGPYRMTKQTNHESAARTCLFYRFLSVDWCWFYCNSFLCSCFFAAALDTGWYRVRGSIVATGGQRPAANRGVNYWWHYPTVVAR